MILLAKGNSKSQHFWARESFEKLMRTPLLAASVALLGSPFTGNFAGSRDVVGLF